MNHFKNHGNISQDFLYEAVNTLMPLQKDPLSPLTTPLAPKNDFPHQKSFWTLMVILLLSGFMFFSQHYLAGTPTESKITKTPGTLTKIDKSISLPILSREEMEAALAAPQTSSEIKEAILGAAHNKRLRLVKMPLGTNSKAPLPVQVTASGITQKLLLTPELQSVILPIDRTGIVNIQTNSDQQSSRTAIALDNFGPFPLQFQPIKNSQINLLVISQ